MNQEIKGRMDMEAPDPAHAPVSSDENTESRPQRKAKWILIIIPIAYN